MNSFTHCIICDNPKVENQELGLCASCGLEKRKSERYERKIKVVKPVKKVTDKRADELKLYPKLKRQFLDHKMICEFRFEGCTITSTQPHHTSLSAKNFLNTKTWIACCLSCHKKCESLPAEERREKGYLTD